MWLPAPAAPGLFSASPPARTRYVMTQAAKPCSAGGSCPCCPVPARPTYFGNPVPDTRGPSEQKLQLSGKRCAKQHRSWQPSPSCQHLGWIRSEHGQRCPVPPFGNGPCSPLAFVFLGFFFPARGWAERPAAPAPAKPPLPPGTGLLAVLPGHARPPCLGSPARPRALRGHGGAGDARGMRPARGRQGTATRRSAARPSDCPAPSQRGSAALQQRRRGNGPRGRARKLPGALPASPAPRGRSERDACGASGSAALAGSAALTGGRLCPCREGGDRPPQQQLQPLQHPGPQVPAEAAGEARQQRQQDAEQREPPRGDAAHSAGLVPERAAPGAGEAGGVADPHARGPLRHPHPQLRPQRQLPPQAVSPGAGRAARQVLVRGPQDGREAAGLPGAEGGLGLSPAGGQHVTVP